LIVRRRALVLNNRRGLLKKLVVRPSALVLERTQTGLEERAVLAGQLADRRRRLADDRLERFTRAARLLSRSWWRQPWSRRDGHRYCGETCHRHARQGPTYSATAHQPRASYRLRDQSVPRYCFRRRLNVTDRTAWEFSHLLRLTK